MSRSFLAIAILLGAQLAHAQVEDEYRRPDAPKNSWSLSHEYEEFIDDDTEPWQFTYVDFGHKFDEFGSVIFRVNRADRFGQDGIQYELDAYPKLGDGLYAYLNVGFSDDDLFPDERFGVQIYKSLPQGWEASLGMRYLAFDETTLIYTGSIGRYWGNWYATLTPYVVPDDVNGTSASGVLEFRYYRSSGDDYWTFRGSYGNAPDVDTLLQITNRLDNWSLGIGRQFPVGDRGTFVSGKATYNDREYSVFVERESVVVQLAIKQRF